jgi:uncharacterized protein YjbI with pentapeptide repeats
MIKRSGFSVPWGRIRGGLGYIAIAMLAMAAMRLLWPEVPWRIAVLIVVVLVFGLGLWWNYRMEQGAKSNLGTALVAGTLVALAVFAFQANIEAHRQALTERAQAEQRRVAERQSLQLTLGLQRDLTGIDLTGRDLTEFYLRGKILNEATLEYAVLDKAVLRTVQLRRASLFHTRLAYSDLRGADMRNADLAAADLRGAWLESADLRNAQLTAADLEDAQLYKADLRGANLGSILYRDGYGAVGTRAANLRRSVLSGADLRGAVLDGTDMVGASADKCTRWPKGFNPERAGVLIGTANTSC